MGWFRAQGAGGPVKGVKLGLGNGTPPPTEASAYDWHCWNLVEKALCKLGRRSYETVGLSRLLLHRCNGAKFDVDEKLWVLGRLAGYRLFVLVASPKTEATSEGSDHLSDVELHSILRLGWVTLRQAIQESIDRNPGFMGPGGAQAPDQPVLGRVA